MPVTLDTPDTVSATKLERLRISHDVDAGFVTLLSQSSLGERTPVTLSAADYYAAFAAETGTSKARAYKVYLAQIGKTGTVT